jgi:predicted DNA-binding ribbon-helix-helix protein
VKTKVRGIRASQDFWDKCQKVAKSKNTDVNKLIVSRINKYCNKVLTRKKDCDKL